MSKNVSNVRPGNATAAGVVSLAVCCSMSWGPCSTVPRASSINLCPHFNANEFRQYIHQVMHTFGATQKKVVMVVDRSGIHRARKLAPTLEHDKDKFELHFLPAHSGHHLNPIEGFWRRMKEVIGAGRGFEDLPQLYRRARQVLMAHQERPIYEFSW